MKLYNYIVIVLLSLIAILLLFKGNLIPLKVSQIYSILGLVITSIAFAFGGYLTIAAVNAYSKIKEIDLAKENLINLKYDVDLMKHEALDACKEQVKSIDDFLTQQISLTYYSFPSTLSNEYSGYYLQRRTELYRYRGILALKNKTLDNFIRKDRIKELKEFIDPDIIDLFNKSLKDVNESIEIKEIIREIFKRNKLI